MARTTWDELMRLGYSSAYLDRVRKLERVIQLGTGEFHVEYRQQGDDKPVLFAIHAVTQLILYRGNEAFTYEKLQRILLNEATVLRLEPNGNVTLEQALIEVLIRVPKSSGVIPIVP